MFDITVTRFSWKKSRSWLSHVSIKATQKWERRRFVNPAWKDQFWKKVTVESFLHTSTSTSLYFAFTYPYLVLFRLRASEKNSPWTPFLKFINFIQESVLLELYEPTIHDAFSLRKTNWAACSSWFLIAVSKIKPSVYDQFWYGRPPQNWSLSNEQVVTSYIFVMFPRAAFFALVIC